MPDEVHWIGPERLVYYVLFPALLVNPLAHADLTRVPIVEVAGALLFAILLIAMPAISIALAKLFGATGSPLANIACCAAVPAASNS